MKNYTKLTIKEWALEDRPREKIMVQGIKSLSTAEILSVIIGSGTRTASAVELSKSILKSVDNDINILAKLDISQLRKIPGIGPARALSILAAFELGTRRNSQPDHPVKKIKGSRDVFEIFHPLMRDLVIEEFWILLVNRANLVLDKSRISQGGISGTVIDTRIILKKAIDKLSSSLILCHNHPSGNLKPSEADIRITEKIKKSGELMDINLLDHLIISDNSYFSFADEGLI